VALTALELEYEYEPLPFHVVVVEDRLNRRPDHHGVVVIIGEVDLATAPRLEAVLFAQLDEGKTDLVVDMIGVEFVDASGMRSLLHVAEQARTTGGRLLLQAPSPVVRRMIDLLNLNGALLIKE
jgi:anti-anti-sigma factor